MSRRQWRSELIDISRGAPSVAVAAIRLADRFHHRPPSVSELKRDHRMSQATAYRWHRAFRIARGMG